MNEVVVAAIGAIATVLAAWVGARQARKPSKKSPSGPPIPKDLVGRVLAIVAIGIGITALAIDFLPERQTEVDLSDGASLKEFQLLVDAERGAVAGLRRHVLNTVVKDIEDSLQQISINFVPEEYLDRLETSRLALNELSKVHESSDPNPALEFLKDEREELELLEGVLDRLQELGKVATSKDDEASRRLLAKAYDDWNSLSIKNDLNDTTVKSFASRFEAYRLNVLGMIELTRYTKDSALNKLANARELFERAIKANNNFPRAYMNIAIVTLYEFERKRRGGASYDNLSQLLDNGEEHLRSALSSEVNERMLSLVLNNLAHYQLVRAEWYREVAKGESTAVLSAGRDFIRRAMNLPQRAEVIFLTAAEIECEFLAEEPDLVSQWSMESKREKLQEVLGLVRTSIDQGYKGYYGLDRSEFFKKKRFFQRLSILEQPGWETQVLIAAGVPLN